MFATAVLFFVSLEIEMAEKKNRDYLRKYSPSQPFIGMSRNAPPQRALRDISKNDSGGGKNRSYWLTRFNRKISILLPRVLQLISHGTASTKYQGFCARLGPLDLNLKKNADISIFLKKEGKDISSLHGKW